jgi:Epoxide hydrolase N terminus
VRIHAVHATGRGERRLPLLITHGWPSTFAEFYKVIPLLTDAASMSSRRRCPGTDSPTRFVPARRGGSRRYGYG